MVGPIIMRLELEGMRYHILQAFSAHQLELQAMIEQEIAKELAGFDFEQCVAAEVRRVLPGIVRDAVQSSLSRALWQGTAKDTLDEIVRAGLQQYIDGLGQKA